MNLHTFKTKNKRNAKRSCSSDGRAEFNRLFQENLLGLQIYSVGFASV